MRILFILTTAALFFSFSPGKNSQQVYDLRYIEKNMAYIPMGSFTMDADEDIPISHVTKARTVTVESFYMFNQEVSNGLYLYYVKEIKKKGDTAVYHKALPDTLVWTNKLAYNDPYVDYYFRHPAYAHYPLVGVTHTQCVEFCKWLTQTYNADPKRKFKKVVFDLPDEAQWEYAARGGLQFSPFPWEVPYMQKGNGEWMANFRQFSQSGICRREFETISPHGIKYMETYYVAVGGGDPMGKAGRLNDAADITAPVTSYWPNKFGLYTMAGNVEEFLKAPGKTKGGSWRDPGYYLQNSVCEEYDTTQSASTERGFRFIMNVIEK